MIEIEDIVFRRDGAPVFDGLRLRLDAPRVAIVGRNGSGKSTLLRLIAGLAEPQAGQVRVGGVKVAKDRAGALATVGILFQNPDHQIIFPTVIEEIAFGLEQQGHPRDEARRLAGAALARAGHPDWAERLCHTLSQGQRQMVCLTAILAMEPRWILFDEPFNSLDIPSILRTEARIAALAQKVVTVTHDPARVRDYDRVIWLEQGAVAADGAPGEVLPAYVAAMERLAREAPC
ncbi:ABC transporter ATP-binding protein [Sinirhodobacter populi]|uniref:ABC transporter ATP-binding protein n=1 Tax=Paenirhodobacter populi TaxID=2306993 RepID=A0A443JPQ7_9RHOB|nr:ABC transporter ATP-binding protein [Sinirhodobacter populi]RWR22483.1 ABC transporter ATP-binding protein [Sinirhodobacter populi]